MNHPLKEHKRADWASWTLLIASPFLLLAILSLVLGRNAFASYPCWSDELDYWRSVQSWLDVGTATGYNGLYEMTPHIGTLSVHGWTPLLLYGGFAKLFGWSFNSIVWCNALWVAAGAFTFCALCKPKAKTALLLALSMIAYVPYVLYATTSMTELADYGLLLFYLAFLWRYRDTRGLPSLVFCCLTVLFCCAYRIPYCLLFVPLLLIAFKWRFSFRFALAALLALVASACLFCLSTFYSSAESSSFLYHFLRADSLLLAIKMLLSHTKANLIDYFVMNIDGPAQIVQRCIYLVVMLLCLLGAIFGRDADKKRRFDRKLFVLFLLLALPLAMTVMLYETNDWMDYRFLAPFLWGTVATLILMQRRWIPAAFFTGCAVALVLLVLGEPSTAFTDVHRFTEPQQDSAIEELCQTIPYQPDAADPYDNTVRIDLYNWQTVSNLHPGLGLQTGWFTESSVSKSRWILTDYLKLPVQDYELVLKNKAGSVYRRLDVVTD